MSGPLRTKLQHAIRRLFRRNGNAGRQRPKTDAEKAREIELLVQSGVSGADRLPPPSL